MSGADVAPGQAGDWEAFARDAARGRGALSEDAAAAELRELLVLNLAGAPYAIPVERIREIVRMRALTPVPRVPDEICGVIALRGEVVQVVDLRMCLGLPTSEAGRRTRIIVLHGDDDRVAGVLVDQVVEVMRVPEEDVRPVAAAESDSVSELFLSGEDFVSILDLDRILEIRGTH